MTKVCIVFKLCTLYFAHKQNYYNARMQKFPHRDKNCIVLPDTLLRLQTLWEHK